jgi:XapX domain-containing protein
MLLACPNGRKDHFMVKIVVSVLLAFSIGAGCRFFDIPVPAPPKLLGGLLIIAITVGYMTADRFLPKPGPDAPVSQTGK